MSEFVQARSADHLDPVPMLVHADWLEERGDLDGAQRLRGLAAAGFPSLAMIAVMLCDDMPIYTCSIPHSGSGLVDGFGSSVGCGDGFGDMGSAGRSRRPPFRDGVGDGHWHKEEDFGEFRQRPA